MFSKVSFLRRENLTRGWFFFPHSLSSFSQVSRGLKPKSASRFQVSNMDSSPEQLTPCKGSPPSSVQKTRKTAFMSESEMSPTDPHVGKSPLGRGTYLMGVGHSGPCFLCFLFHCHIPSLWMGQSLQPSFSSMGNRNELKRSLFASPSVVSVGYFCHTEEKHQFIQWPHLIKSREVC